MTWLAIAFCLIISFVFSGIEAGILSLNRVRLRHRASLNDAAALKLQRLLARPERLLVTVLLVTNLMNITALVLFADRCVAGWGRAGYALAMLVALPIDLFGLELLPKSLFRRFPYRALALVAELLRVTDVILSPVLALGAKIIRWIPRRHAQDRKLFVAREDFKYLTIESERHGALTKTEREMIHNIIDYRHIKARDVMVPIAEVKFVPADLPVEAVLTMSRETKLDRLPVMGENGKMIGLINVFEMLLEQYVRGNAESHARRIVTVSSDEDAYNVVRKLRAARITAAAVLDSSGRVEGVAFSEDLIRRLIQTAVA